MNNLSITTKDLRMAYMASQELSNTKLPIKASYWISRIGAKLKSDYDVSEKTRMALVAEHGEVDANGNSMIRGDAKEAIAAFLAAWTPVEDTVIEVSGAPTIDISAFGTIDIQPSLLSALAPFLSDGTAT